MRLFWEDPYMQEFESSIEDISGNRLVLAKTAFYAESGGQVGDTGSIADIRVNDTQYSKSGKTIYHLMQSPDLGNLKKGDVVHGKIDWERRYKVMKLHSALHITYLAFIDVFGQHKLRGSQVREDKARVDFVYHEDADQIILEQKVNEIIAKSLPIDLYPSDDDPKYRFWEIDGFEPIPCGGTHVKNTEEVGKVQIKIQSKGSQGKRVYCSLS